MGIHVCWQMGDYVKVKYASSVLGMNFFFFFSSFSFHVLRLQVYLLFFCDCVHWHSSLEFPWLNETREFFWQKTHTLWEFLFLKEYHLYSVWNHVITGVRCIEDVILNMMSRFPVFLPQITSLLVQSEFEVQDRI